MAATVQFATEADIPELLLLRLAVDADQARRFGNDRWIEGSTRGASRED